MNTLRVEQKLFSCGCLFIPCIYRVMVLVGLHCVERVSLVMASPCISVFSLGLEGIHAVSVNTDGFWFSPNGGHIEGCVLQKKKKNFAQLEDYHIQQI
jgi:hypothetical protein